jgi:hypothetical protein
MKKPFYEMFVLFSLLYIITYYETSKVYAQNIRSDVLGTLGRCVGYATLTIKKSDGKSENRSGQITKCEDLSILIESGGKEKTILRIDILDIDYRDGKCQQRNTSSSFPALFSPVCTRKSRGDAGISNSTHHSGGNLSQNTLSTPLPQGEWGHCAPATAFEEGVERGSFNAILGGSQK